MTDMVERAICKLCGEEIKLSPEQIMVNGTENWVHGICHHKDMAALRARAAQTTPTGDER